MGARSSKVESTEAIDSIRVSLNQEVANYGAKRLKLPRHLKPDVPPFFKQKNSTKAKEFFKWRSHCVPLNTYALVSEGSKLDC